MLVTIEKVSLIYRMGLGQIDTFINFNLTSKSYNEKNIINFDNIWNYFAKWM